MTDQIEDQKEKKVKQNLEHMALVESSSRKLDRWLEQINAKKKIRIPRRDLLNWWISRSPENLSNGDINALIEEFYDEEVFLRQLLRDVKKAKREGLIEPAHELILRPRKIDIKKEPFSLTPEDASAASESVETITQDD
jgi:hypothetical protein